MTATEDSEIHKFLDFNQILENIVEYTNSFNRIAKSVNRDYGMGLYDS